jgi:hypothetical protein
LTYIVVIDLKIQQTFYILAPVVVVLATVAILIIIVLPLLQIYRYFNRHFNAMFGLKQNNQKGMMKNIHM